MVDLVDVVAGGQRVGSARRALRRGIDEALRAASFELAARREVVLAGLEADPAAAGEAWRGMLAATSGLASLHDAVGQLAGLDARVPELLGQTAVAARRLISVADAAPPAGLAGDAAAALEAARAGLTDPERFARALLGVGVAGASEAMRAVLDSMTELRVKALHAVVLHALAAADPAAANLEGVDRDAVVAAVRARARGLRDAARDAAGGLAAQVAEPLFALGLWAALFEAEEWLVGDGALSVAGLAAAAGARRAAGDGEAWARAAALAYDELRVLLAFDAGIRAVLAAVAAGEVRALRAFERTRILPLGEATLDLPRSTLPAAASAAEGTVVEVVGVVREVEVIAGGPAPRSVLTIGPPAGQGLGLLVPFLAVNSFGVAPGVWVQARGVAHPAGKDGVPGPLVQVGRVRRQEAASASFTDSLIWAGRRWFELRPGGVDLVAGRLAGDERTLVELGLRD